ncbi:hypothetical protein A2291_07565 [candidate division WOR-1 bacterium RIFOXYB2_FULL_42_35]|uniref:Uncharacterized protein n=1 Tax=candidate division WOR-1 bacterium RIFOXYC2_FULL_41_25 TaxID=1802586 RepID=A0A1F4TJI4_UNCSA|nr:MAG: hypothetical protein A2247_08090 [candidate division WOR-1 bacterium RIFOXYA2_FULL_41_14]OGC21783.1 MAG: hypothetical protein A2291_07565 [candidate division WOR-1 bacterium RIFOXYB2_FULL_42_35]OGC32680.1 MAG: hypothetical protein A2462_03950 [candidate division WOR-1 bacterium RIFOXYC2_FULL_41_25]OGC41560.1 MAG: hypothetical protein A2548_01700 [candidate division WOR-1 bacterium RIFOXYD2_FULL_41_8]
MTGFLIGQIFYSPGSQGSSGVTNTCQPMVDKDFPDVAPALDYIMKAKSTPVNPTLAFGYTHREDYAHRSAIEAFASDIVPWLAKNRYDDIVLEIFPQGEATDPLEKEIASFNQTGKIGQEMKQFINVVDKKNFEFLLMMLWIHGIKIHSGGVDYENINNTILHPNMTSQEVDQIRREVARNTAGRISALRGQGKKTASLNGCLHTDIYPTPKSLPANFVRHLPVSFGKGVVEVDLTIPEISTKGNAYEDLPLSKQCQWKEFIPNSGMRLVSEGPRSYLLVWSECK